jgi:hypothetical protein
MRRTGTLRFRGTFGGSRTIRVLTIHQAIPVVVDAVIADFGWNFLVVDVGTGVHPKETATAQGENIKYNPFFHFSGYCFDL